ncbi:MAG: DUF4785 family protein [Chiayiivirga sp.]|jgi:hypothetical protein|uniref:DUF4785 domain-containing protein n=1 Tax=Chiayiivirga sp. TaxID=2041042 RepID=UPI0025B7C235|nr:DUF4785 domain-containing protein [Chiayiivirga sp.]MCI1709927.1 DUF4785 family protein [Chiayiivirga sp.]MCI1730351.1 DUF4785 family protein [Chiayiivirga sp.]
MTTIRTTSLLLAFAMAPFAAQAGSLNLLPATEGDQIPTRLFASKQAAPADLDRVPARISWALDPNQSIEKSSPHLAESREYWKRVKAEQLAAGVTIHTSAEGAVLRLSPLAATTKRFLDPQALEIRYAGRRLRGSAAIEQLADAAQLKASGLGFPEHSIAFRLKPELGAGDFELALPHAGGDVLLHVFEPRSQERLHLSTARAVVLQGEELAVNARFDSAQGKRLGELVGTIAAPNGQLFDLRFDPQADGTWQAKARIDAAAGRGEGLWEVHATGLSRDGSVQRDIRTAFDAVTPGARLLGRTDVAFAKDGALRIALPIAVASASRYNVSALLYGSNAQGQMRPLAIAHSAVWAEPGETSVSLAFDPDLLAQGGLGAPYELRQLELTDFATRSAVESRARALRFDPN